MTSDDRVREIWTRFCDAHAIAEASVPLFAQAESGVVETFSYGLNGRPMLRRSPAMRQRVLDTAREVISAPPDDAEGLLYMMLRLDPAGGVVPLYIGKAGRIGRLGNLSANLLGIDRDEGKFARWGYNYAYHLGDLSAATLPGHAVDKVTPKYKRWAEMLFELAPAGPPRLRFDVRFWCTAWRSSSVGIWREMNPCSLSFSEYLLIGVASLLFPESLLNREGVNRSRVPPA